MLPSHGRLSCQKCFETGSTDRCTPHPKWQMVNDPGHWGSSNPEYLVLGFSKGATQAETFRTGIHEEVAFAKMRPRLEQELKLLRALHDYESINEKIQRADSNIAFASLIRCSLTREDTAASVKKGSQVFASSGNLIVKSFSEIPHIIQNCVEKYLTQLPSSLKVIFFLGTADAYVREVKQTIQRLYPNSYNELNPMAFSANDKKWVFIAHPSPANGTFGKWLEADDTSGQKRDLALKALGLNSSITSTKPISAVPTPINRKILNTSTETMNDSTQTTGFTSERAKVLLSGHLSQIGTTKYISGFMTSTGKNIALQTQYPSVVKVWIEHEKGKDPREIGFDISNRSDPNMPYAKDQPRNSNLGSTTAPRLKKGRSVWNVIVPSEAHLNELLAWYK